VLFWLSLAVFLVALLGGLAYAGLRGFQLYRRVKATGGAFTTHLDAITATVARIEANLARAEAASGRLQEARERLAVAGTRMQIQLAAVREAYRGLPWWLVQLLRR
jgi:hypothetical protein